MNHVIKIIKGSLVGLGSILPGISGSMVATILKIYTELITALNQFTKKPIRAILSVWQYIVGVALGYLMGFFIIKVLLTNFPIPFTLLMIGFILGSIPSVTEETKGYKKVWHHYAIMGLAMLTMLLFLLVQEGSSTADNWTYYLIVFLIGFITAASLITPGLSAATLLMAVGYFHLLIELINDIGQAFITFNFAEIGPLLPMLLMFVLGIIIGMIVIGKVMYHILMRYKVHFYLAVLGIILISPVNILVELLSQTEGNVFSTPWYLWLIGGVLLLLGVYTTYRLSTKGQTKEKRYD